MKYIITSAFTASNDSFNHFLFLALDDELSIYIKELKAIAFNLCECETTLKFKRSCWSSLGSLDLDFECGVTALSETTIRGIESSMELQKINVVAQGISFNPITDTFSVYSEFKKDGKQIALKTKPIPYAFLNNKVHNVYT